MFRRITGLFVLLTFLLVKAVPLFASDHQRVQNTLICCIHHGTDENSEAEEESKQIESADEDFIGEPLFELASLTIAKKAAHITVPDVMALCISLPYPPPDYCS
ncbi:hypothetical protein ABDJ41_06065 [Pedobacter sp. ASV1-7]|uniref:hypothetical protein n=1 Tax=Pedobacter sp. ASV1-7 TaxID=3145237 RepID=UPI0032E8CDE0